MARVTNNTWAESLRCWDGGYVTTPQRWDPTCSMSPGSRDLLRSSSKGIHFATVDIAKEGQEHPVSSVKSAWHHHSPYYTPCRNHMKLWQAMTNGQSTQLPNYPIIHPDYYPSYPNYDTAIFVGKNLIHVWCKNSLCNPNKKRKRSEHSTHATLSTVKIDMGAPGLSNAWLENWCGPKPWISLLKRSWNQWDFNGIFHRKMLV